jgi:hypothetical protein
MLNWFSEFEILYTNGSQSMNQRKEKSGKEQIETYNNGIEEV